MKCLQVPLIANHSAFIIKQGARNRYTLSSRLLEPPSRAPPTFLQFNDLKQLASPLKSKDSNFLSESLVSPCTAVVFDRSSRWQMEAHFCPFCKFATISSFSIGSRVTSSCCVLRCGAYGLLICHSVLTHTANTWQYLVHTSAIFSSVLPLLCL